MSGAGRVPENLDRGGRGVEKGQCSRTRFAAAAAGEFTPDGTRLTGQPILATPAGGGSNPPICDYPPKPGWVETMTEPKEFLLSGVAMKRLVCGEQTNGSLCLFENRSEGHTTTPIHMHSHDDETVYVIEGQLTAISNGEARTLSPGESAFLKRGIPHQLANPGDRPVRYILIGTPSVFERFLAAAGRELRKGEVARPPTLADVERLKRAAPGFGISLLSDWPTRK